MLILLAAAVAAVWFFAHQDGSAPPESPPADTAVADPAAGPASGSPSISADGPAADEGAAVSPDEPVAIDERPVAAADQPTEPPAAEAAPTEPPAAPAEPAAPADAEPVPQWRGTRVGQEQEATIGSLARDSGFKLMCRLTNVGAAVVVAKLTDHFVTVDDKKLYESNLDDPVAYEQARQADPAKYRGHYTLCEPVILNKRSVGALAIGEVYVEIVGQDGATGPSVKVDLSGRKWQLVEPGEGNDPNSATFFYTISHGLADDLEDILRIYKTYTVNLDDYTIEMSIRLENLSPYEVAVALDQIGPTGLPKEDIRGEGRRAAYGWFAAEDQTVEVKLDSRKDHLDHKDVKLDSRRVVNQSDKGYRPVLWTGTTNKYFASLMYLRPDESAEDYSEGSLAAGSWREEFYVQAAGRDDGRAFLTGVKIGAKGRVALPAGASKQVHLAVYAGPKDRSIFVDADNKLFKPLYGQLDYISTIEFGGCCGLCTMTWLAMKVIWLLGVIAGVAFNNYGVAIIVLVVVVRLCLHPLTKKSQVSMMKMQKLQPQIQKLREKYADDKDTLNKEMMRIYKEQGATPLLGCLPMLLQMPILIALFTGINASVALRHAAFLPVWITDLAAPDALFSWGKDIPWIGSDFNLLPILLCGVMFLQTKMNPQMAGQQAGGGQQAQQAKMMKIMMPAMMLVFFYKAPSGLTLYFMASMAAGVGDQWAVRRHIRAQEEIQAATETTIEAPGKAARGHRPKKPKDPYKTGF